MPIELPILDDLDYRSVRDQLIRRIPIVAPEWTDHNDSDPGIAMVQLFAYLAEQLGYRLNQVPEKSYLAFLRLIGMRMLPATAARTRLNLILAKPEAQRAFMVPAGARVTSAVGDPNRRPVFEVDDDRDCVPAQLAALVSTSSNDLRQLRERGAPTFDGSVDIAEEVAQRYTLLWNGTRPRLEQLPASPLPVFARTTTPAQSHLFLGLAFNPNRGAGFIGERVTLTVQLDDDEQPDAHAEVLCGRGVESDDITETRVSYRYYASLAPGPTPPAPTIGPPRDGGHAAWSYRYVAEYADGVFGPVSHAGTLENGPPGAPHITVAWGDLPGAVRIHLYRVVSGSPDCPPGRIAVCRASERSFIDDGLPGDGQRPPQGSWRPLAVVDGTGGWSHSGELRFEVPLDLGPIPDEEWVPLRRPVPRTMKQLCADRARGVDPPEPLPELPHPLIGALPTPVDGTPANVPVSGWLAVSFPPPPAPRPRFSVRALSFNVAAASHARTVAREALGRGTGRPGQVASLAHRDVLAGTLALAVEDPLTQLEVRWREVEDFDGQAPDARVFVLDAEAGEVGFGDGVRGLPPPEGARLLALGYRYGGGAAGNAPVGTLTQSLSLPSPVQQVTNLVPADGGRDAETLEQAKQRAPRELAARGRAVTAEDFDLIARRTPNVRVRRTQVIPLRRPFDRRAAHGPGVDHTTLAPGALTVVIVPDADGGFPTPTPSQLRQVCRHLDRYRLLTTELHVASPQYVRLFQLTLQVRPRPGYTRATVRDLVSARLSQYFHVFGGPAGDGLPFGETVHHADLVTQVLAAGCVDRVEGLEARFDGQAPARAGDPPALTWRRERQAWRRLTSCPTAPVDSDRIELLPDEHLFVDTSDLVVVVQS